MAKSYFGFTVLRGLDHLYIKEKDYNILRRNSEEFTENIKLKGRAECKALEIEMTNKEAPKNSDPVAIDTISGGCLLIAESILVILEELGFNDFKALPVTLNHKATKRSLSFWLFKCTDQLQIPLQEEAVCFHAERSTDVYFNKAAKEKIEALNPNCLRFEIPYNINEF